MLQLEMPPQAAIPRAGAGEALPRILRKGEFARLVLRSSPAYVSKLIRLGKLTAPAITPAGKIDRVLAVKQLAGERDPDRVEDDAGESDAQGDTGTIRTAKLAELEERRRKLARENDEAEGKLCMAADVDERTMTRFRRVRDVIRGVPQQLAGALVGRDEMEILRRLRTALDAALTRAAEESDADDDHEIDAGGDSPAEPELAHAG